MPIVPRAEKQVNVNALPDSHMDERAPGGQGLAVLADAQQNFGHSLRREALGFGELAIRKQQEVDGIELAKIKAERDAFVTNVITEEERDPDYAGMNDRIQKRIGEYDGSLRKNVNGRILKYVDNMITYNNAQLVPKVQEIYLKKQDDRAIADALTASKQFEDNGDYESAIGVWDGVRGISESKRAEIRLEIQGHRKKKEMMDTAALMGPELWAKTNGDRGDALSIIRDSKEYSEEEKKYYMREVESYFVDKKQAIDEDQAKAHDHIYGMIRGGSSLKEINKAIGSVQWASEATKWQLMDARDAKFKIGKFAEGGSGDSRAKTDLPTLLSLWSMADAGTLIDKAPNWKTFYSLYGKKLSMTDLKTFRSMYKSSSGSDIADPAIKMQQASIFNKYLDQEKITDLQVRARAIDRYNYEIGLAEKANKNMPVSNEASVAIMAKVVGNVVVGTTRTWYGRKTDKTAHRFEIPPGAELRDKTWYFPDPVSGKWLPLSIED